jgi:hypothetical protein
LLKHVGSCHDVRVKLRAWVGLFVQAEPWEQALPRFVCYIMSVREDVTAQQLNQDFWEMLGRRAGDIVMTEAERLMAEGEKRGLERGVKQGLERGLAPLIRLFQRRLGRDLAEAERATLSKRLTKLGPDRLGDVVLDLSPQELAAWLSDPNAM